MEYLNIETGDIEIEIPDDETQSHDTQAQLCLVGRFITNKPIRTYIMKEKMAAIWLPVKGVNIEEASSGIFVFQFYHTKDVQRVLRLGPWSFDNHLLVIGVMETGMSPTQVPHYTVPFWIQVHNLPIGFMPETIGKHIGNTIGNLLEYDANNSTDFWKKYRRL